MGSSASHEQPGQDSHQCLKCCPESLRKLYLRLFKDPGTNETEKSHNSTGPKFIAVADDHDFLCDGFSSKRVQMSCGHTVTPESLTLWCQRQLDEDKTRLGCGVCDAMWSFEEVCKIVQLTKEEMKSFEQKLFQNRAFNEFSAKCCPGCKSIAIRKDPNNLCVQCPQCTADKGNRYEFCWQCRSEWRGPAPRSDRCENECCSNKALETLRTCPEIEFKDVKGITGCPSFRACPTCGVLVEHSGEKCKNIDCPNCKVEFCFVCLKITTECLKTSSHYQPCSSGVAPRQSSIPVKS